MTQSAGSELLIEEVARLRLQGKLDEARKIIDQQLQRQPTPQDEIALRFELAKVYDRIGLHTRTRPVAAALHEIDLAAVLATELGASARPHFALSLEYRKQAGAIDASLFAAVSLGNALIETCEPHLAQPHLLYALEVAQAIPSPFGAALASMQLGAMHERLGENDKGRLCSRLHP